MNMLPLLLYIVAGVAYAFSFAYRSQRTGRLATASLAGAALVHTFVIGMRTVEVGQLKILKAGTHRLSLKPIKLMKGVLMDLRTVTLKPVK
mgnify:CR=1 FL=1